jgi:hypothetical protein
MTDNIRGTLHTVHDEGRARSAVADRVRAANAPADLAAAEDG